MADGRFADRVVLIAGAAGGMGSACARAFSAEGASLVLVDAAADALHHVSEPLARVSGEPLVFARDVARAGEIDSVVSEVLEHFGRIDVLINTTGLVRGGALHDLTVEAWDATMDINVRAPFLLTQACGRPMLEAGSGSIVNITSIAAQLPRAGGGAYSVSKAALRALTELVAVEWGPRGIRCNAVAPGYTAHGMRGMPQPDDSLVELRAAAIPTRRVVTPDEIAETVLFLASERSSAINGMSVLVDGGFAINAQSLVPSLVDSPQTERK